MCVSPQDSSASAGFRSTGPGHIGRDRSSGHPLGGTGHDVTRRTAMGADDKLQNMAEKAGGKAKEMAGKATDDERLEAEGRTDQMKSDVKQAGEKVKDAFKG
jgi:uncharacterized protein YjbJ (UPF0337 family)